MQTTSANSSEQWNGLLTTAQMQANTGAILGLASGDVLSGPWVFTPTSDYPRIKKLLADGSFGELLPILATAIDATSLAFISEADGSSQVWYPQKRISNDGIDAIQSGVVIHNQKSCVTTTVSSSSVSFNWKVSSESAGGLGGDFLRFYVDGSSDTAISGEQDWDTYTHNSLPAQATELKWCYEKDHSVSNGMDAGWIDQLTITP